MKPFCALIFAVAVAVASGHIQVDDVVKESTVASTVFTPQAPGSYTFELTVSDGCSAYRDDVTYTVECEKQPHAAAGSFQSVTKLCGRPTMVTLDGAQSTSSSTDPSFEWSLLSAPTGSEVSNNAILSRDAARSFFYADVLGTYEFELKFEDCCGSSSDITRVSFGCNSSPIAFAGDDQSVLKGTVIELDGSSSYDPDEDPLTYEWEILSQPVESNLRLADFSDANGPVTSFPPDVRGNFVLKLHVSDCCSTSSDEIVVSVGCNDPPTANAGGNDRVTGLQRVEVDGSASSDPNGDKLVFSWDLVRQPEDSLLESADIIGFNVAKAFFMPDVLGLYEVELTVSDCCSTTKSRKSIIVGCNDAPFAVAGSDQVVKGIKPFPSIELRGCSSYDPNGDALEYQWKFSLKPETSRLTDASIDGSENCLASFTPDALGMYELTISVSDKCTVVSDTVRIIVGCNSFPTANAGQDQTLSFGCTPARVNLDGSASTDPEGDILTYEWRIIDLPEESRLTSDDITDSSKPYASLAPDVVGVYDLELVVTDSCTRDTDKVRVVYSCNRPPKANAGADRVVTGNFPWESPVMLQGRAEDVDSPILTYSWSFKSVPEDSLLTGGSITNRDSLTPSFEPDVQGRYELELAISDCCSTTTDGAVIRVTCGSPPTANAGKDEYLVQECEHVTQVIVLDGSASYDPDNVDLVYEWEIVSAPQNPKYRPPITSADSPIASISLSHSDRVTHSDEYILQLSVSDSCSTSTDQVKITYCCNDRPTANAGIDRSFAAAPPFPPVYLDGSQSVDPNHDHLDITWTFVAVPDGSKLINGHISNPDTTEASFTPDERGDYELKVHVADCCSFSEDTIRITVTCDNPPIANAGPDQLTQHFCNKANTVQLDGTDTSDPDGEPVSFRWSFEKTPSDSTVSDARLTDSTSARPMFTPDVTGDYVLRMEASDGCSVVSDTVTVTYTCEGLPVANAGEDQFITSNPPFPVVHLSGKESSDPYGDISDYHWEFTYLPAGSNLHNSDLTRNSLSLLGSEFRPDAPGCYDLRLTITGCCAKATDRIEVCVGCNADPKADAGKDQELVKGARTPVVQLDGCGSTDPDSDSLTFKWEFTQVPDASHVTGMDLMNKESCMPAFTPDVTGVYELMITIYDGCASDSDKVQVKYRCNSYPVVDAGSDRSEVNVCGIDPTIELDGSASSDPDNDPLLYRWKFVSVPEGSTLNDYSINNATSNLASFIPDAFGSYELELTGQDYCFQVADRVKITYKCNEAPVADAGTDQGITAYPYPAINLFGSNSYDPNGDDLTFSWEFIDTPPTSILQTKDLVSSNTDRAIFVPDVPGVYMISLTVSDCCSSVADEVKITVSRKGCNTPPVVSAGDDQLNTKRCSTDGSPAIRLDGSGTYDEEHDPLTFKWKFTSKPEGSILMDFNINDADKPVASFKPDYTGVYKLQLVVSDGCSTRAAEAEVQYTCNSPPVSNAGNDVSLDTGGEVILPMVTVSGSGSYDIDNDPLFYAWRFIDKAAGSCMSDDKLQCTEKDCSFTPDVRGCFELELAVSDCCSVSTDTVKVCLICNSAPIADAGRDQTVRACPPFDPVYLQGADVSDMTNKESLVSSWKFSQIPADSRLSTTDIGNKNSERAYFTPDMMGLYEITLVISDGCSSATDKVRIFVGCNTGPISRAGGDQDIRWDGQKFPKVTLDGSDSEDPDKTDELTYNWKFVEKPNSSQISDTNIYDSNKVQSSFWPDVPGVYEVELSVADCCTPGKDTVLIRVECNGVPSVSTGEDQVLKKGCDSPTVILSGNANDPDGDGLTYEWRFTSIPPGSKLANSKIVNPNSLSASFVPDITGSFFELTLSVSDGCSVVEDRTKVEYECNNPPRANAGPDQTLIKGCEPTTVFLDGSSTVDDESDPLTWEWQFNSLPQGSALTNLDLINPSTARPSFVPDVVGLYEIELTVKDCCEMPALRCTCMKDRVLVTLTCQGSAPLADAGDDMEVNWHETQFPTVQLDGTRSKDADDDDLVTFKWTFTQLPSKSKLGDQDIVSRLTSSPSFVPDVNGMYELQLSVSDCCYLQTDKVVVSVRCDGPPVTHAGPDQCLVKGCNTACKADNCLHAGKPVFLDGTASFDPDNEPLQCHWNFTCKPTKSALEIEDIYQKDTQQAYFYADVLGTFVLEMTCFDGCSYISDEVVITIGCNDSPTAHVEDKIVAISCDKRDVLISGSASSDPDGDEITYNWEMVSSPPGSDLDSSIFDGATAIASFRPDKVGEYELSLLVSDCCTEDTHSAIVTVGCTAAPIPHAGEDDQVYWDGVSPIRVALDGSLSDDMDSHLIQYDWDVVQKPTSSMLTKRNIVGYDTARASFDPDTYGKFIFELAVTDCCSTVSDTVTVSVLCNNATSADAGHDRTMGWQCGAQFPLSGSYDGLALEDVQYNWRLTAFNGHSLPEVDVGCDYRDALVGENVELQSSIHVPGVANPKLRYSWSLIAAPKDSFVTDKSLSSHHSRTTSFVPDAPGDYVLQIEVFDDVSVTRDQLAVSATTVFSHSLVSTAASVSQSTSSGASPLLVALSALSALSTTVFVALVTLYRKQIRRDLTSSSRTSAPNEFTSLRV